VREQRERRSVAAPADARDEIRPLGDPCVQLALDARRLEVLAQQLGRRGLAPGRVRRVEPDQPLEELRDLAQRRLPITRR
jgi:hypothetical protein